MPRLQKCARSSRVRNLSLYMPLITQHIDSDLMAENHTLRGLLRSLSAFIGEGAGGVLPKLGWNATDFENYVNRAETDTAWESFQKHKRDKKNTQAEPSSSQPATNPRKRSADDATSGRQKRQRSMTAEDDHHVCDFPVLSNSVSTSGNSFNDMLRSNASGSPMFMSQNPTSQPTYPASGSGNIPFTSAGSGSTSSFLHGLGLESPTGVATDSLSLSLPPPRVNQNSTTSTETTEENEAFDPKGEEAGKLIAYA